MQLGSLIPRRRTARRPCGHGTGTDHRRRREHRRNPRTSPVATAAPTSIPSPTATPRSPGGSTGAVQVYFVNCTRQRQLRRHQLLFRLPRHQARPRDDQRLESRQALRQGLPRQPTSTRWSSGTSTSSTASPKNMDAAFPWWLILVSRHVGTAARIAVRPMFEAASRRPRCRQHPCSSSSRGFIGAELGNASWASTSARPDLAAADREPRTCLKTCPRSGWYALHAT